MTWADYVTVKRDNTLDLVVNVPESDAQPDIGSIAVDEGDEALRRDLAELLHTPMYTRIYDPFYGHRFDILAQAPDGLNVVVGLKREWTRLCQKNKRVDDTTADVEYDDPYYIFTVKSLLSGRLISVAVER